MKRALIASLKQGRVFTMAAPTKVARLEKEIGQLKDALAMREEAINTLTKQCDERANELDARQHSLENYRRELETTRKNLVEVGQKVSAAQAEIANLQRLNAIQAGYIQRANEDEQHRSMSGLAAERRGPKLDHAAYGDGMTREAFDPSRHLSRHR